MREEFQHLCRYGFSSYSVTLYFSNLNGVILTFLTLSAYPTIPMSCFRFLTLALQRPILELTWQLVPDQSLIQVIPGKILE